jgi:antitoxin VapB
VYACGRYLHHGYEAYPMPFRSEATEALAACMGTDKTEAVAPALRNELQRLDDLVPLRERLRPIRNRVLSRPATGLEADKAFYDNLSGDH